MIRLTLSALTIPARPLMCAGVLALTTATGFGQIASDLPRSIVETISVSASQKSEIESYVNMWAPRIRSDDAGDNKRALEALTKPLHSRGVSVAFRLAYAQSVNQLIRDLSDSEDIGHQLAALRLAAALATPGTTSQVRAALSADDQGKRLFAVSRAGQVFETTRTHGPAITAADAVTLIEDLREMGAQEDLDPEMVRAIVRSLASGTRLPSNDLADARSRAIIALSDIVGMRLQALDARDDPSFEQVLALEAASAATQALSDISSTVSPQAARAGIVLGGDIISVALRRVLGKTIEPAGERDLTVSSVQAGESLLYFARRKAAELANRPVGAIVATNFSEKLAAGEDRDFRNDASVLLGPGSDLLRQFDIANDRFLRE